MLKSKSELKDTIKFRIAMLLSMAFVIYYYYKYSEIYYTTKIIISIIALIISIINFGIIKKYDLIHRNYVKGIGAFVFVVFAIFWKRIHTYSPIIEMAAALVVVLTGLILSFKYSASELEGKKNVNN